VAFDVLRVEREELSALPLTNRRSRLEAIVPQRGPICATVQTEMFEVAEEWLAQSRVLHLEGVVAKRADESYRNGKRDWDTVDLVVGGDGGTPERMSLSSRGLRRERVPDLRGADRGHSSEGGCGACALFADALL
jgi:hypothetical protein